MENTIKLSEYCDIHERKWNEEERKVADRIVSFLNKRLNIDLNQDAKTNNNLETYKKLRLWLLFNHKKELLEALRSVNIDFESFQKWMIYSLIVSASNKRNNLSFLIQIFKSLNIIKDLVEYEKDKYKLVTTSFGEIYFETALCFFKEETETLKYVKSLRNRAKDGCHEISFYLIKKYKDLRAITSICTMDLNKNYYHSFVLTDKDEVIDFTENLVMSKNDYYLFNDVYELNCINYSEYLEEKNDSICYDESNNLYDLLRNALFKEYVNEGYGKINDHKK